MPSLRLGTLRRDALLLFLLLLLVYSAINREGREGYEYTHYLTAGHWLQSGRPTFVGADGKEYFPYHGLAPVVLQVPLLWAAVGVHLGAVPGDLANAGGHLRPFVASSYLSILSALTVLLVLVMVWRRYGRRVAWIVALLTGCATIVFPYAAIGMEATLMFGITLACYAALRWQESGQRSHALMLGIAGALTLNSKMQGVALLFPIGIFVIWTLWKTHGFSWRAWWRALWPMGLTFLGGAALYIYMQAQRMSGQGSVGGPGLGLGFLQLHHAGASYADFLYLMLVSPGKALVLFSPPLILAVWGWRRLFREWRSAALLVGSLAAVNAILLGWIWLGGYDESWGPRYFVCLTPLLCLACAPIVERLLRVPYGRFVLVAIWFVGLYVQILGVAYPYVMPILVGRAGGARTLYELYYVPQYSPILINSQLLASYADSSFGGAAHTMRFYSIEKFSGEGELPKLGPPVYLGARPGQIRFDGINPAPYLQLVNALARLHLPRPFALALFAYFCQYVALSGIYLSFIRRSRQ